MRILFLVRRVGPYHDVRFEAAGRVLDLKVVETRSDSKEYPWTTGASARHYGLSSIGQAADPEIGLRGAGLEEAMDRLFATIRPEAVACTGWADPEYHAALRRCHARRIPAIVMSDSTYADEPRRWWKEQMKRPLVLGYSAAVVAGSRSRDYLRGLGFTTGAIFEPWDVVDNGYFAIKPAPSEARRSKPYFLCISRYLPKKNLFRLIEAFAGYRKHAGAAGWDLVILGSGELANELDAAVVKGGVASSVHRPGFVQYGDLPAYYHGAGACILPSVSDQWGLAINEAMAAGLPVLVSVACGCCPDLVVEGETGFAFDPTDVAGLTALLLRMATMPESCRQAMGAAGRARISQYSPARFAEALAAAVNYAGEHRKAPRLSSRLVLSALARRK